MGHQRDVQTHDARAEPPKLLVATPISRATAATNVTVNLHDEPHRRREKVGDVAVTKRHLLEKALDLRLPAEREPSAPPRNACHRASSEGVGACNIPHAQLMRGLERAWRFLDEEFLGVTILATPGTFLLKLMRFFKQYERRAQGAK